VVRFAKGRFVIPSVNLNDVILGRARWAKLCHSGGVAVQVGNLCHLGEANSNGMPPNQKINKAEELTCLSTHIEVCHNYKIC
jgi:hypothetical protein